MPACVLRIVRMARSNAKLLAEGADSDRMLAACHHAADARLQQAMLKLGRFRRHVKRHRNAAGPPHAMQRRRIVPARRDQHRNPFLAKIGLSVQQPSRTRFDARLERRVGMPRIPLDQGNILVPPA